MSHKCNKLSTAYIINVIFVTIFYNICNEPCYMCDRKEFDTYRVRLVLRYVVEIFITYAVKYCYKSGIYYLRMW